MRQSSYNITYINIMPANNMNVYNADSYLLSKMLIKIKSAGS